jgi:acetyl-CoA carboxylase carboxyltransferase component
VSLAVVRPPAEAERATPLERLELLCDAGSLRPFRTGVVSRGSRSSPGDGVLGASGTVGSRPLFCYAQDGSFAGGSLGASGAATIVRVLRMAARARAPVVGFVESGGARMEDGTAALAGYGELFRASVDLAAVAPQVTVVTGTAAGGGAYAPALTDVVIMTRDASMFLTGPGVVRETTGEVVTAAELGGARVHERSGVCAIVRDDEREAAATARDLLALLPRRRGAECLREPAAPPLVPDPSAAVPLDPRRAYDVRGAARGLVDGHSMLELSPRWARNIVTALARIDGRPVGLVANQPRHLGGVLDAAAAEKAARFVTMCDRFGVPLVVLVDTPGFLPGTRQESSAVIRHGAALLRAFAAARVPKLTVVLRKAFGGGYITMNSRALGADLALAWPEAEIGIMAAQQAVAVLHRRDLRSAPDPEASRRRLAAGYADQHLSAAAAARAGEIDELVEPAATRGRLIAALESLEFA